MNPIIPYEPEERAARAELEPLYLRVRGLCQLRFIFMSAHRLAKAYGETISECSAEQREAYSKAIIVGYAKPWSRNNSRVLKQLDKAFLKAQVQRPVNKSLRELRNKLVAHIDE